MLRQDDLMINGWKIWQDTEAFCFGTDAVLLAWFSARKLFHSAMDLGCGNGIIPLLLAEYDCAKQLFGVDRDAAAVALAQKSVFDNGLEARVKIFCGDFRQTTLPGSVDLITCNPPYFLSGTGKTAKVAVAPCRTEQNGSFADFAAAAARSLRYGGRFCFIQKPERLPELFAACTAYGLEPKELLMVCSRDGRPPEWVLIECRKGGKSGLKVLAPLVLYDACGRETEAFSALHHC